MKRIILILAALALFVGSAEATTTYLSPLQGETNRGATLPMVTCTLPAMTSSDTAIVIYNVQRLAGYTSVSGVGDITMMWGWNVSTATESASVSVGGAWTKDGPWTNIHPHTLQANTLTSSIPYVLKSNIAATTVIPFPFHRVAIAGHSTIAVGAKFFVQYMHLQADRPYAGP